MAGPKLVVSIVGDASSLERSFVRANRSAKGFGTAIGNLSVGFGQLVKGVVIVDALQKAMQGLSATVGAGISEFKENAQIQAQTTAALKSTGSIAGVTSGQIRDLSLSLSNLSGISDESIRSAENVELAFTNIRNSAGKGNDIFTQATKLIVDFSARTGKDAPAAALLFGKALEDPAKRVGILARAGVVLSTAQVKVLKSTEATQGILAAQKILLADLSVRFSGAAAAAGKTLPGALDILKERFKDLAGEGVGAVAPALTKATVGLSAFVVKLSQAQGVSAKLDVLGAGLKSLGRDITAAVKAEVAKIDWNAVFRGVRGIGAALVELWKFELSNVRDLGVLLANAVSAQVEAVDWARVLSEAGQAVGRGLVASLQGLTRALHAVDWNRVGKTIVDGAAIAIAAVVKFLAAVNWVSVARALFHAFNAALKAQGQILLGAGEELGKLLLTGISKGLAAIAQLVEKQAIKVVLAMIEPFTHLPGFLGGGPFRDLKDTLNDTLDQMAVDAQARARKVGQSVAAGIVQGLQDGLASIIAAVTNAVNIATTSTNDRAASLRTSLKETTPDAAAATSLALKPAAADIGAGNDPTKRKGITASQRNTFFDNQISRLLDQASDGSIKEQIAKLKVIGADITARIAATKDVTRRLTLESTLLDQVTRPIKALQQQASDLAKQKSSDAFQALIDSLQLNVDRAAVTQGAGDDLSALQALADGIKARIKKVGETSALEEQLLGVTQQIKTIGANAKQAVLDALNFRLTKAEATTSQQDDLSVLSALQVNLKKQLSVDKGNLGLQQQLFDVQQKRKAALAQVRANAVTARNASQFKAIGLTATGDQITPGVNALKRELGSISGLVSGTFLDTSKTQSVLSQVAKVLSEGIKKVGQPVRAAIKSLLDDLKNQLGTAQPLFKKLGQQNLFAGLGLDRETENLIKQRLSIANSVPTVRSAAFANAGASSSGGGVHYHGPVTQNFNGVTDIKKMRSDLDKQARNRPLPRRGT